MICLLPFSCFAPCWAYRCLSPHLMYVVPTTSLGLLECWASILPTVPLHHSNCTFKRYIVYNVLFKSTCECKYSALGRQKSEGIRSPRAGVTGSYDLTNMGAGNPIRVLCKSSMCFFALSHLFCLLLLILNQTFLNSAVHRGDIDCVLFVASLLFSTQSIIGVLFFSLIQNYRSGGLFYVYLVIWILSVYVFCWPTLSPFSRLFHQGQRAGMHIFSVTEMPHDLAHGMEYDMECDMLLEF